MNLPTKPLTFDEMQALMLRIVELEGCKITINYPDSLQMTFQGREPSAEVSPMAANMARVTKDSVFHLTTAKEKP